MIPVLLLIFLGGRPATAHEGGLAKLRVTRFTVEGHGSSAWMVKLSLADSDSGKPEPTFRVTMTGNAPGGASLEPLVLTDLRNGDYEGHFEGPPGSWALVFKATPLPTADAAQPFEDARTVVLTEGKLSGASVPSRHSSNAGGGGVGLVAVSAVALFGALLVAGLVLVKRRRPASVPSGS